MLGDMTSHDVKLHFLLYHSRWTPSHHALCLHGYAAEQESVERSNCSTQSAAEAESDQQCMRCDMRQGSQNVRQHLALHDREIDCPSKKKRRSRLTGVNTLDSIRFYSIRSRILYLPQINKER